MDEHTEKAKDDELAFHSSVSFKVDPPSLPVYINPK